MSKVDGMVEDGFETIRDAFAQAQVQDEGGAQLCVQLKTNASAEDRKAEDMSAQDILAPGPSVHP